MKSDDETESDGSTKNAMNITHAPEAFQSINELSAHLGQLISELGKTLSMKIEANLGDILESFVGDVKQLPKMQKDYQDKQEVYNKAVRSYLNLKGNANPTAVAEKDSDRLSARKEFEVARFRYVRLMNDVRLPPSYIRVYVCLYDFIFFYLSISSILCLISYLLSLDFGCCEWYIVGTS